MGAVLNPTSCSAIGGSLSAGPWRAPFLDFGVKSRFNSDDDDSLSPWPDLIDRDREPPITTSVLVSTRDHGEFIEDCIDSLLVQTRVPDEIIVYDDGSEDDTACRLRAYGSRIVLIEGTPSDRPNHARQAHAFQTAFARCSGRLIFLLHGSDRFKRQKIEHYAAVFADSPDVSLIQGPLDKIDEFGRVIGTHTEPRKHVAEHLKEIYRRHDVDLFYPTSSLAFTRAYLDSVQPLDLSDGLAVQLATRLSMIAPHFGRVVTLPQALTDWRCPTGADIDQTPRRAQIRQLLAGTRAFNHFCRRYGLRTISAWRSSRFYWQLLRCSVPEGAYRLFRHGLRRRTFFSV
jgi:glycosyltransferase involved in cell wall biosynthesis